MIQNTKPFVSSLEHTKLPESSLKLKNDCYTAVIISFGLPLCYFNLWMQKECKLGTVN